MSEKISFWKNQISNGKYDMLLAALLLLYALIGCNQGFDLTDTTYSLGNYLYFKELSGEWIYATFLANAAGHLLIKITGGRMLLMNLAGGIVIGLTAVLGYYGLRDRIPRWLLFGGELIAVGLCWCPRVILYNYLTYFLLTAAAVILYKAVQSKKNGLFFCAGALLGINVLVRVSNLTEAALILLVWYCAWLERKEEDRSKGLVWKQTGCCIGGYLTGMLAGGLMMVVTIGAEGYAKMFGWIIALFTSSEDAGGYSMSEMLGTILKNYMGSVRWLLFMAAGMAAGIVMFAIKKDRFLTVKKFLYLAGLVLLGVYFNRNGVFNAAYYNVGSIFHLCVLFFWLEWILCILLIFHRQAEKEDKLLALLAMIILMITPIGSNNHLYTCINNMFLSAPIGLYMGYRLYRYHDDKIWKFACSSMCAALAVGLLIQSIFFHRNYVFRDGVDGTPRDEVITASANEYAAGMRTRSAHAEAIEGLTAYAGENFTKDDTLLSCGDIPGVSYLLHMPPALSTIWPDLESFQERQFLEELDSLEALCKNGERTWPILILSPEIAAYVTEDAEGMQILEITPEQYQGNKKLTALSEFIVMNHYYETYSNAEFVVMQFIP